MPEPLVQVPGIRVPLPMWERIEQARIAGGFTTQSKWIRSLVEQAIGWDREPAGTEKADE